MLPHLHTLPWHLYKSQRWRPSHAASTTVEKVGRLSGVSVCSELLATNCRILIPRIKITQKTQSKLWSNSFFPCFPSVSNSMFSRVFPQLRWNPWHRHDAGGRSARRRRIAMGKFAAITTSVKGVENVTFHGGFHTWGYPQMVGLFHGNPY